MSFTTRDSARIPEMLALIQKIWDKHDQQRFGQLVINLWGQGLFFVEDDEGKIPSCCCGTRVVFTPTPHQRLFIANRWCRSRGEHFGL